MADLHFFVEATATGALKEREGHLALDGHDVRFSVPGSMGGKGVGASPETLLIGAVTACYSLTLMAHLRKRQLPYAEVGVRTEGVVTGHPGQHVYARIIVNPAIRGVEAARSPLYREAAAEARDSCFIGHTVAAGGLSYELGSVTVE